MQGAFFIGFATRYVRDFATEIDVSRCRMCPILLVLYPIHHGSDTGLHSSDRDKVKRQNITANSRGDYKCDKGWEPTDVHFTAYKQHRFYVSRDRREASIRMIRLDQLWEAVENRWRRLREHGLVEHTRPI